MNRCWVIIVVWGLLGFPLYSAATDMKLETTSKTFILHLGATRVIDNPSGVIPHYQYVTIRSIQCLSSRMC